MGRLLPFAANGRSVEGYLARPWRGRWNSSGGLWPEL
jgi:hypothetical protein